MTLTTHAVVGAAAMTVSVNALGITPTGVLVGFAAGFVSHFMLDAVPHWNEGAALLYSVKYDESKPLETDVISGEHAVHDLAVISIDGLVGLLLSLYVFSWSLFHLPPAIIFLGAAAGELPDALQFVYFKMRFKLMEPLQLFHSWIQIEFADWRFLSVEVLLMLGAVALAMAAK